MFDLNGLRYWLLPFLWTVQIFYFSLLPRGLYPRIGNANFDTHYLQYIYHSCQFFCLSLLVYRAFLYSSWPRNQDFNRRALAYAVLALLLTVALLDESIQIFVPTRSFTVRDLAADIFGGAAGVLLMHVTRRKVFPA
jgi:VanZ family protein